MTMPFFGQEVLVSADHVGDTVVVVRRRPSNTCYGNGQPVPDTLVRHTYGVNPATGKLALLREEFGTVVPPTPERFEFPDTLES